MFSGTTAKAAGQAGGDSTGVRQVQALSDEEGEVPTAPSCPLIPQPAVPWLLSMCFPWGIPCPAWPLCIHGFQQAVVHSRSLNETWLSSLYQNQLSEMMSLGKLMETLLSTSPVPLLLSFGGWYLRHSLICHSFLFLEPSYVGSTLNFFSSQRKSFWCLHRSDTKQPFLPALLSLVLLLEIIHVPTVLIHPWKGGELGCV